MPEPLSRQTVAHVATLARLDLSDDDIDRYAAQLSAVLAHADALAALLLEDVPPTAHPLPLVNVMREDVVGPLLDRAEVLSMAPDHDGTSFRVPRILGEP
jgi:aspartyl-tRNA(Asn)/glutamyl-tRNA(Gln) amidotransferase subunit C